MSARPRPRPRPVAKLKPRTTPNDHRDRTDVPPSTSTPTADEDAQFMRNRGRTAAQWKQLHQLTRNSTPVHAEDDDDDGSEESSDASRPSPARRFKRKKHNDQPRWQTVDVAKLQKNLLSSDGDSSDIEIIESIRDTQVAGESSPNKRKRQRSRSRSITPPPALSDHQLANAKYLVRKALAVESRTPSPTLLPDDSLDNIVLNPELAKIVEEVKKQAARQKIDAEQTGGPETVTLNVNWIPHPLNVAAPKPTWTREMKRHDSFRVLFEETADLASILVDHLVVTYDGKRVFPSGTPHSLRIWTEGELEACDKNTYEYMRTRRLQRSHSPPPQDDASEDEAPSDDHSHSESDAESSGGDKLKLVFRSTAADDVTLTVRPTTTCGAIVKAFLKAAGLPDIYSDAPPKGRGSKTIPYPQLKIDGDKQTSTTEIGDADLEDGDLVEVVGI
ncbi:hypothetical protein EV401DRAFT_1875649 [Pisolithus croceorrhizus]|nr:hypothetical protein EV401DRAFT_1875649 [Pisolithus croceorrhizus]